MEDKELEVNQETVETLAIYNTVEEQKEETKVETVEEVKEVEEVNATEVKEDIKEVKEENVDITANSEPTVKEVVTVLDNTISQSSVEKASTAINVAEQLEAIKKELESVKAKNEEFATENKKLKDDIASLRENPVYKPTETTNEREMKNSNEYSVEDVNKMRKMI